MSWPAVCAVSTVPPRVFVGGSKGMQTQVSTSMLIPVIYHYWQCHVAPPETNVAAQLTHSWPLVFHLSAHQTLKEHVASDECVTIGGNVPTCRGCTGLTFNTFAVANHVFGSVHLCASPESACTAKSAEYQPSVKFTFYSQGPLHPHDRGRHPNRRDCTRQEHPI